MQDMSAWTQALGGFVIGVIAGFAVRHARLCSFGAIEDAMMGGDTPPAAHFRAWRSALPSSARRR